MAEPASTATAAALKTRREMDDLCVMVESSKFIAEVQWSEFWGSTVETGTTDFSVSNYQIIFRGCRAPGQGVPGCVRATARHAVWQIQGALDLGLKVCRLFKSVQCPKPRPARVAPGCASAAPARPVSPRTHPGPGPCAPGCVRVTARAWPAAPEC